MNRKAIEGLDTGTPFQGENACTSEAPTSDTKLLVDTQREIVRAMKVKEIKVAFYELELPFSRPL